MDASTPETPAPALAPPSLGDVRDLAGAVRRQLARARERLAGQIASKAAELPGAAATRLGALAEAIAELEDQDQALRRVAAEAQRIEAALAQPWAREPDKLLLIEAILVRARAAAREPLLEGATAEAEIEAFEWQLREQAPVGPSPREVANMLAELSARIEGLVKQLASAPAERYALVQWQLTEAKRQRALARTVSAEIGALPAALPATGTHGPAVKARLETFKARVREFAATLPEHMSAQVAEIVQLRFEFSLAAAYAPSPRPLAPLRERLDRAMQVLLGAAAVMPLSKLPLLLVQAREIEHMREQLADVDRSVARVQQHLAAQSVPPDADTAAKLLAFGAEIAAFARCEPARMPHQRTVVGLLSRAITQP